MIDNKKLLFFITLISYFSCSENRLKLDGTYTGAWAETRFQYNFSSKNEFEFKTEGHFGYTTTKGKYAIVDSFILLQPFTDWTMHHGVLKERMRLMADSHCIRDFDNNFYCLELDILEEVSEKRFSLQDSIENRLLELDQVKEITSRYAQHSKYNLDHPRFSYDGIVLVERIELHLFLLRIRNEDSDRLFRPFHYFQGQKYLVDIQGNKVFQHHSRKDSLSYVDKLFSEILE